MPGASSKGKVLVAMSGGVDSSVAAAMLVRQGYEVIGCFMRLGSPGETLDTPMPTDAAMACKPAKIGKQGCCSINDAADARLVASTLDVPFYVCNFKSDFGRIMDYFVADYAAGRTPNPCVRCNDWLKFGRLHEYAEQLGCDFVASGHYARVAKRQSGGAAKCCEKAAGFLSADAASEWSLLRGIDGDKDQSYVLFGVPRNKLAGMILPIGEMRKSDVRSLAQQWSLPVFDKPDSQEICFIPDNDYASFVDRRLPADAATSGEFVDDRGNVIGAHAGQHRFTIGQRRGLGNVRPVRDESASGTDRGVSLPLFVIAKDPRTNRVTLGPRERLLSSGCTAGEANWLTNGTELRSLRDWRGCWAQHRYNAEPVEAHVRVIDDTEHGGSPNYSGRTGRFEVRFAQAQEAVTPGQAIVIYTDTPESPGMATRVLGGGWIDRAGD